MRLTKRILEAIIILSCHAADGEADDFFCGTEKEVEQQRNDAINAGSWARQVLRKREAKKQRKGQRS